MNRKDCLDYIAGRTGRPRKDVEDVLDDILERAEAYEGEGLNSNEAYSRARDEMLEEFSEKASLRRREEIMNKRKEVLRMRYYTDTAKAIEKLPAGRRMLARLKLQASRLALEAKLVGVNVPFFKSRASVDAQYVGLRRLWIGGLSQDLDNAGLLKIFASRGIEDRWADELFELNKKGSPAWQRANAGGEPYAQELAELTQRGQGPGSPGVTKDPQALAIARIIQKWQRESMGALNREGAWVRSYSGYITRTSHDPDKIRSAGPEKWIADTMPRLDIGRTFGTKDPQRARDALFAMWRPMMQGDHFDYGRPIEETLYPTPAKTASSMRELHFKSGKDWRAYNEQYGAHNATHTVVEALRTAARRTALMREFGTRPREAYESDKQFMLAETQREAESLSTKLGALETAYNSPHAGANEQAALAPQMEALRARITEISGRHEQLKNWQVALDNRFAQIDGTSMKPVSRASSNFIAGVMSVQRTSKLGNLFATHFASLVSKSAEAAYWGIPFAERYGSLFRGLTNGLKGTDKRAALEATLVGFENRLGHIMNAYDVADAPAGFLHQTEETFFKLTGVNAVIDNQRGDFEAMAARHLGLQRDVDWNALDREKRRILENGGIGEKEWAALKGAEWSKIGDRTFLFPSDAMKLTDDQVRAYIKADNSLTRSAPTMDDLAQTRQDLATRLASLYADRGGYAIPMPSARTRAILFGKNFEPGSGLNTALKLFWQFKLWPIDIMNRAWGREMYGRIGDNKLGRVANLVETAVAATIFGTAAEGIRDIIKGQDPIAKLQHKPIAAMLAGAQRSGMGSIIGDFLLGQFDRHGLSAAANILGPTFGQVDDLAELLHAGGRTKQGMFGAPAMRERGATLLKMIRNNTPFMNLWATSLAMNSLVWHRLQEAISPGYLQRSEQRQQQLEGTKFWVAPAKTDQFVTGKRPAFSPSSSAPLGWNLGG